MKCGKQLREEDGELCGDCGRRRHGFVQGIALYDYGSIADSVFRFKYCGRQEYATFYGRQLYAARRRWLELIKPEALVPVPIHPSRKRMRGYNQAELIARALSEQSGIPVNTRLIIRSRKTLPQKGLNDGERQNNLKRAFKIRQNDVKLKTIVIIDDIYTTGSTMEACAQALKVMGAEKIYGVTLCIGHNS